MNMGRADRLTKLYEQGLTSLEEERFLSRIKSASQGDGSPWFEYVRLKRSSVPADIEEQAWDKVAVLQQRQRWLITSLIPAAASVLVITAILTASLLGREEKASKREITAALEEAMSMISDNSSQAASKIIIYEDQSIIIYIEE